MWDVVALLAMAPLGGNSPLVQGAGREPARQVTEKKEEWPWRGSILI